MLEDGAKTTDHKQKMVNPFAVSHFSMLRRLMFHIFRKHFRSICLLNIEFCR